MTIDPATPMAALTTATPLDLRPRIAPFSRLDDLRAFAYFPVQRKEEIPRDQVSRVTWQDTLDGLAALAEAENWTGTTIQAGDMPILDSYLRYTFRRLTLEGKITFSDDCAHAAFNTGLLTPYAEDIFGLFATNTRPDTRQPWVFQGWATESDSGILSAFPTPPVMARYFETASDLVYDVDRELKIDYRHILEDHPDRLAPFVQGGPPRYMAALESAKHFALKRVRRNHKLVVPQWHPKAGNEGAQLLLPLDLTGDGSADVALVARRVGEYYQGKTVLTLDMAYSNARLVARPDSEWLRPQASSELAIEEGADA